MKAKRLNKNDFINHWRNLNPDQPLAMTPIPCKHSGSTYDQDGIRILGSEAFIDSVLSRLKDLLKAEAIETRLQVNYQQAIDKDGQLLPSYSCYIQIRKRSKQGCIMAETENKQTSPFIEQKVI